jgi:hypothetical protein
VDIAPALPADDRGSGPRAHQETVEHVGQLRDQLDRLGAGVDQVGQQPGQSDQRGVTG